MFSGVSCVGNGFFFKYIGTNEFVYTKKLGQGGLAGVGLASWLKLQEPM